MTSPGAPRGGLAARPFALAFGALFVLACGGEAALEPAGLGPAGGAATDAGVDLRRERCTQFCDLSRGGFCDMNPSCVDACLNTIEEAGDCTDELAAALDCIVQELTLADGGCDVPPACQGQSAAYQECLTP